MPYQLQVPQSQPPLPLVVLVLEAVVVVLVEEAVVVVLVVPLPDSTIIEERSLSKSISRNLCSSAVNTLESPEKFSPSYMVTV